MKSTATTLGGYAKEKYEMDILSQFGIMFTDPEWDQFAETCIQMARAKNGARNNVELGELEIGANISGRNAAMSRIAEILGEGNLLARSTNAEITQGGKKTKGNLMEGAVGRSLQDMKDAGVNAKNADISAGTLQRQMICLQLLDTLCMQVDRNINNFFLTESTGPGPVSLLSVQGIDNDLAFGKNTNLAKKNSTLPGFLKDGEITLPLVDKNMAERIMALDPNMLLLAIGDVITSDTERTAIVDRLNQMKAALRKLKSRSPQAFLEPGEWGEASRQQLMSGRNYYSGLSTYQNYL
jgi:hypothetical protein